MALLERLRALDERCAAVIASIEEQGKMTPELLGALAILQPWWLAVLAGLKQYLRTYPFSLIAPLMLQQPGEDGQLRRLGYEDVAGMDDESIFKAAKRLFAGESLFLNHFTATREAGEVWLGSSLAGDMMRYELDNETLIVQAGSFVACEHDVNMDMGWQGFKNFLSCFFTSR